MKIFLLFVAIFFLNPNLLFAQCQKGRVSLQVLGSGGPELNDQRASTSYLIWLDNKAIIMIDAGSGSSYNFEKSGANFNDIKAIAFSHFHVDHSADLSAYVKYSYFSARQNDLHVYGPDGNRLMPSTTEFINALFNKKGVYPYMKQYINAESNSVYHIITDDVSLNKPRTQYRVNNEITLNAVPVHHGPIAAVAWRVNVVGCSITFSGDMSNKYKVLAKLAKGSDILVAHNAVPQFSSRFALNLHMPPSEIGLIAEQAKVKQLVLSHRMRRTLGLEQTTLNEIKKNYNGEITFANDLSEYHL